MSKKTQKTKIVKDLKALGSYKTEYDKIIDIYAGLLDEYETFEKQFEEGGYKVEEEYTNKAGAVNMRKTPIYGAMEALRKDIVTYSDRLGLNPKAMESITTERSTVSKLDKALLNL